MPKNSEYQALLAPPIRSSKSRWRGYYELTRLHKPVMGNTLMFWPCGKFHLCVSIVLTIVMIMILNSDDLAWGLTMAAYNTDTQLPTLAYQLSLFAIGSTLMHSAACVINDICDIEFDKQVGTSSLRLSP